MFALIIILCSIPICFFGAIASYVLRYQWKTSKLPKSIPRHPTTFGVIQKLSAKPGNYEEYLSPFFNPDETTKPMMHIGPSIIGDPVVVVTDADAIKEILTNTTTFPKYPSSYLLVSDLLGEGLVVLNGSVWKHHRRVSTPLFHHHSLKLMNRAMLQIASEMTEYLKKLNGQPISATFYQKFTMKVIIATTFGEDFDSDWMAQKFQDLTEAFNPYVRWSQLLGRFITHNLPFGPGYNLNRIQQDIRQVLCSKITERRSQLQTDPIAPEETSDLLTLLILNELDDEAIVNEGLTFLFAGSDTTSYLMSWVSYYLSKFPEIQEKVSQESQEALNADGEFDEISLTKMPYLRNVLRETLRIRPPVEGVARYTSRDTVLCGTAVPAGTVVSASFHMTQTSGNNWKNPRNFDPDRFDSNQHHHAYANVPFSAGERNCIGQKVAMQEAMLFAATLVKNFEIKSDTISDVKIVIDPLMKASGLTLKFQERKK